MMNRAVFLDRDGVINRAIIHEGKAYAPHSLDSFHILPNVAESVIKLRQAGFLTIVVTNQPEIARGTLSAAIVADMHQRLRSLVRVDDIFVCPHKDSDECPCRKPKPGMMFDAAKEYGIDLSNSFLVGDSWKDMEAAGNAGCKGILIKTSHNKDVSCFRSVENLAEAVDVILSEGKVS